MIKLLPILPTLEQNERFASDPDCKDTLEMTIDYYKIIGYNPPWVCYYAEKDNEIVGSAGFKGQPVDNKIEIAYGTVERFRQQGIATMICEKMVQLARQTDPSVIISARTLPEENYSTKVLRKNGFVLSGPVWDKDDGEVWEWIYKG